MDRWTLGAEMQVGDLCRVRTSNTHNQCQFGDLVILLSMMGGKWSRYVEGVNIKTQRRHHYRKEDLQRVE